MNIKQKATRLSIDLSKDIFQIYGVDKMREKVFEKRITSREKFATFIVAQAPCEIVTEACGSANYWARKFTKYGCEVKLISPQYVKPYAQRNKNDAQDAKAIMEASFWSGVSYVKPKTVAEQDMQSLLRIRASHLNIRIKMSNQLRGLMKEYGVFVKVGYAALMSALPNLMSRANDNELTLMMKELIEQQYRILIMLDEQIGDLDKRIKKIAKENELCSRLQEIEGVGPITAVAIVARVGEIGSGFKNGRHFSASLGLVPKQHSSGQRERLLGISKRGDCYLRELLIHGGRAVVRTCSKKMDPRSAWVNRLKERAGANKAAVAIANKNARIAMAMILSKESYKKVA